MRFKQHFRSSALTFSGEASDAAAMIACHCLGPVDLWIFMDQALKSDQNTLQNHTHRLQVDEEELAANKSYGCGSKPFSLFHPAEWSLPGETRSGSRTVLGLLEKRVDSPQLSLQSRDRCHAPSQKLHIHSLQK